MQPHQLWYKHHREEEHGVTRAQGRLKLALLLREILIYLSFADAFFLKRLRLHTRKQFFRIRVVKHWHRLPREAVEAPSLEAFKARLDGALSNLV